MVDQTRNKKASGSPHLHESNIPNREKKSINPAEIWITLRLPTRVNPKRPVFSL